MRKEYWYMKDYMKPEIEYVEIVSENVTDYSQNTEFDPNLPGGL